MGAIRVRFFFFEKKIGLQTNVDSFFSRQALDEDAVSSQSAARAVLARDSAALAPGRRTTSLLLPLRADRARGVLSPRPVRSGLRLRIPLTV